MERFACQDHVPSEGTESQSGASILQRLPCVRLCSAANDALPPCPQIVAKEKSPKLKGKAMGEWESPISSASAAADALGISEPKWDGEDLYWLEYRPMEARQVC